MKTPGRKPFINHNITSARKTFTDCSEILISKKTESRRIAPAAFAFQ
jgi:hypothetical protein